MGFCFEIKTCSQCEKKLPLDQMYRNKLTSKIWCRSCLTIEEKKRNQAQWEKRSGHDIKDAKSKSKFREGVN